MNKSETTFFLKYETNLRHFDKQFLTIFVRKNVYFISVEYLIQ